MNNIFQAHCIYSIRKLSPSFNDFEAGNLYYGDNSFTLEVTTAICKYFFKFFLAENIKKVKSEIFVLKFLQGKKLSVPEFLRIGNDELFYSQMIPQVNTIFYATKVVEGTPMPITSWDNLYKVIDYVSLLHKYCAEIDMKKIKLRHSTGHQNLIKFYLYNFSFFNRKGLAKEIEYFINLVPYKHKMYPIHSDIHCKNMIFSEKSGITLIDFSDIRIGYFEDDLGKFFQYILYEKNVDINVISLLIETYEKISKFTVSRTNIYISIIFNTIHRYFSDAQFDKNNHYHNITKNVIKLVKNLVLSQ